MARKYKQTILVTGGAGFIGSSLCERLLKAEYRVICLDNFNNFYLPRIKENNISKIKNNPNFLLARGDILDKKFLEKVFQKGKIRRIVHLAAAVGVRTSLISPEKYVEINVKGTVNLLEIARGYQIRQFIFGSSSSIYGKNSKIPFKENEKNMIPISPYGATKLSGEIFCQTYQKLYNIPTTILRFFTVYGPRQRPEMAIYKFVRLMFQGKPIPAFDNGESARDYTYIDDIIDGIIKAIQIPFNFEIINLGGSRPIKLEELIRVIGEELKIKPKIKKIPNQLGDPPLTHADISKAKKIWQWQPKISIEKGLKEFIDWYKK